MPEMLNPGAVNYVATPSQANPIASTPKQPQAQAAPQQPAAPVDPFRPAREHIPVILLPHEADDGGQQQQPAQQERAGEPVRLMRDTPNFGAAMAAAPGDDAPGLQYADYLQEHGFEHLGEVIRRASGRTTPHEQPGEFHVPISVNTSISSHFGDYGKFGHSRPFAIVSPYIHSEGPNFGLPHRHDITVLIPTSGGTNRDTHSVTLQTTDHELVKGLIGEMAPTQFSSDRVRRNMVLDGIAKAQARNPAPLPDPAPERFAAYQAPKGGLIARGVYYKAGEVLPKQSTPDAKPAQAPAAPPPPDGPMRSRMKVALRSKKRESVEE